MNLYEEIEFAKINGPIEKVLKEVDERGVKFCITADEQKGTDNKTYVNSTINFAPGVVQPFCLFPIEKVILVILAIKT